MVKGIKIFNTLVQFCTIKKSVSSKIYQKYDPMLNLYFIFRFLWDKICDGRMRVHTLPKKDIDLELSKYPLV